MRRTILLALTLAVLGALPAAGQSRYEGWASAIIAADWRSGDGTPIQAFDNARRDLTAGFLAAGFSRADMYDASLRPDAADPVSGRMAVEGVAAAAARASRGCLLYFTSHGSPQGMVFGPDRVLSPTAMAILVRRWCHDRPTVVVISACYSGVFVDALAAPNRMIMTAARRDRSSFGCGAESTWPYFDGCVIEALPTAADFVALANAARACVREREAADGLQPSEPQVSLGANMQLLLPTLGFNRSEAAGRPGS